MVFDKNDKKLQLGVAIVRRDGDDYTILFAQESDNILTVKASFTTPIKDPMTLLIMQDSINVQDYNVLSMFYKAETEWTSYKHIILAAAQAGVSALATENVNDFKIEADLMSY